MMPICVHNLCSGDEVTYSLPILVGEVQPFSPTQGTRILVENGNRAISWPVVNGRFKALVELVPGGNCIKLQCSDDLLVFMLELRIPNFSNFVRPIYIKCRDDVGDFQGTQEEDRSSDSALRRISLAARYFVCKICFFY